MVYVVVYNDHGCELEREKFKSMDEATTHVIDICRTKTLIAGDKIAFEEAE